MHPAKAFRWEDEAAMLAFVGSAGFARLFAQIPAGPRVAHAPVLVTAEGRLRFHLANANALTPHLDGLTALAVAEGPNAYVSADWYTDVRDAVPTWNYVAVEAEGPVTRLSRAELIDLLDLSAATFEPRVGQRWTRAKMEPARFEAMLNAITGFELTVTALRGTAKLSQNKAGAEVEGVLAGLDRTAPSLASAARSVRG